MFKLIIQDDEGKTTVVPVIRDEITIGRKEGNTIRLTERNVSRRHARLVRANGSILLEDLDSYNGIRVNGTRIQGRIQVAESDRIQIGDYLLELKVDRGAQAGDPFADQRTQPMDRADLPVVPQASSPNLGAPISAMSAEESETTPNEAPPAPLASKPPAPEASDASPTAVVHQSQVQGGPAKKVANGSGEHTNLPSAPAVAAAAPAVTSSAPSAATAPDVPGRMVVVSSNFAGREFLLERPAMVVGRTDDNDIVVNHRSISRHHAKIVREHGRYAIVDLQSSNGVRVNGEEYGKVELRRGDLVDLGHVRLRFVEPGEDFVFNRDAHVVHLGEGRGGSKGALVAILALLVVAGGGAAWFLLGDGNQSSNGQAAPTSANVVTPVPVVTPPTAPPDALPATAIPPTPTPVADGVSKFVADARKAAEEERWEDELASAKLALGLQPEHDEAKLLAEQARKEMRNKVVYDDFVRAAKAGNLEEAMRQYRKLPEDSYYTPTALPELERLRDELIGQAKRFSDQGACNKLGQISRRLIPLFPETRSTLDGFAADCTPPQPVVREPRVIKQPVVTPPPVVPTGNFTALLDEAKAAANSGQFSRALGKAEDALGIQPGEQQALTIAAFAACKLKSEEKATRYVGQLKGQRQQAARQICLQSGLTIP